MIHIEILKWIPYPLHKKGHYLLYWEDQGINYCKDYKCFFVVSDDNLTNVIYILLIITKIKNVKSSINIKKLGLSTGKSIVNIQNTLDEIIYQ